MITGEKITITVQEGGERIDALLPRHIEGLSRSAAQRLLELGAVTLRGVALRKSYVSQAGDEYKVALPEAADAVPEAQDIALDIVFEDADLIVINKARGMVVHPAAGHADRTLVNALLFHCGDSLSGIGGEKRPGIVHRIDKDTSGLIIAAKNDFAHAALSRQLADRSLSRVYECIVRGKMRDDEGTVDAPVGRHPTQRTRMAVTDKASRSAVTHWRVLARYRGYTHLECRLQTGRTHQIRVHMAHLGHPLLGDGVYGAPCHEKGLSGQCLHARRLKFIHPRTGEAVELETALPEYFSQVLARLGPPEE